MSLIRPAIARALALLAVLAPLASPADTAKLHTPGLTCKAFDADGQEVYRSRARRDMFRRLTGYPLGRPGYEVDHVVPLCAGGCDLPSAMQWLTVEEHRAKSRHDAAYCAGRTALSWTQERAAAPPPCAPCAPDPPFNSCGECLAWCGR